MLDEELLSILACPETRKDLALAAPEMVEAFNRLIRQGRIINRAGEKVSEEIQGGLVVTENPQQLYPVRNGIPILLIDESMSLKQLEQA